MSLHPQPQSVSAKHRKLFAHKLPLRSLLILPFVLQLFAAVGLVGYLSFRNGQKAVNDLANQLMTKNSSLVDQHLDSYLNGARQLAQSNSDAIDLGALNPRDTKVLGQYFWKQMQLYDVGYISFGAPTGEYAGAGYGGDPTHITISESDPKQYGNADNYVFNANSRGDRANLADIYRDYQFQQEAWYAETVKAGQPIWSQIYQWQTAPFPLSVSANRPIFNENHQLIGIINIDQRLSQISEFLRQLQVSPSGRIFIVERNGLVVASSSTEQPFTLINEKPQRLKVADSSDPLIQASARFLSNRFGNFSKIKDSQQLEFDLKGEHQFVQVTPWQDEWGLDWLVVVAVPESDFMARINANNRTTVLLCLGALAVATVLGIYTSRWITRPILRLRAASQAIASGQLDQRVEVAGIDELESLSHSFNQMAGQLQSSFAALEKSNEVLEQRVEERTEQLSLARKMADAANQAKSEFLANMSHELRTPLNGILGYAQILPRTESLSDRGRKGVEIIQQCGAHLLNLINDVLDLSKIEARKLELLPVDFYLAAFLDSVAEICRIRAEQKCIAFQVQLDPDLPIGVHADEKRLRQVLINLLSNAIKFTEQGGVTFAVKAQPVPESSRYRLRFQVTDTGVGMTADQLEKIFLPFEQVGEQKRQAEGTGLGLAISQKIVALMDSQIEVQSQAGRGSTFWFEVELAEAKDWAQSARVVKQGTIIGYQGEKRTLLIVDDKWENRSVIVNLLEPIGFSVVEASNGREGLEQSTIYSPALVITDLLMPVLDGFALIEQLRQTASLPQIPIIASSASVFETDQYKSIDMGATAFLPKPVDAETLLTLLQKYLKLEWIYDKKSENKSISQTTELENTEMISPDKATLQELLTLVQDGDTQGILELAQKIAASDAMLVPFAQHLTQLASNFQLKRLEEWIQQYQSIEN